MKKTLILAVAAIAATLAAALPAQAHHHGGVYPPPYWVEDVYQGHEGWSFPEMVYARLNNPLQDHFHYWYNGRGPYCIRDRYYNHDVHVNGGYCYAAYDHHGWRGDSKSRHVAWCRAHYRSYRVASNTFVAHSGAVKRCNSPYDGR